MASRISPVEPGTRPALAGLEARILASRGRISPLYQVLLNSAPVVEGWEAFLTAIRQRTSLDARLRELVILRVAVLNGAHYEFDAHVPHAKAAGASDADIDAIRRGADPGGASEAERAALRLTDAMTREVEVSDALYAEVAGHFDDTRMLELAATVGAYNMVSRVLVALRIGH